MRSNRSRLQILCSVLLGTALVTSLPLAAQEGYDPLRQITQQVNKANLLILQDRTGSMAWTPTTSSSPTAGAAGTGNLYWNTNSNSGYDSKLAGKSFPAKQWTYPTSTSWATVPAYTVPKTATGGNIPAGGKGFKGDGTDCIVATCQVWKYVLVFEPPTRMSMVKNVFGNTVNIFSSYVPPLGGESVIPGPAVGFAGDWASVANTVTVTKWDDTVTLTAQAPYPFWTFMIDYGSLANAKVNPGTPFNPITANKPTVDVNGTCTVGTCQLSYAKDLLNQFSDRVNWGLTYYNTSATNAVTIRSTGTAAQYAADIVTLQGLYGTGATGLTPSGSTGTKNGFVVAKAALQTAINADVKVACDRPYGVILVTDGLSNSGNPDDGDWIKPCGAVPPLICDAGTAGFDCPSDWSAFAAANANDLFLNTKKAITNQPVRVRTWSIGVSTAVGPCELDYIAYQGRTDASSPNRDAGWGGYHATTNPYLPYNNPIPADPPIPDVSPLDTPTGTTAYPTTNSNYDGPTGQYKYFKNTALAYDAPTTPPHAGSTGHGHNAFFATNAEDLAEAIATIVDATAVGDYATNAPTSGQAVGSGAIVMLPSTKFPGWLGHFWAFDTNQDPAAANYVVWDAGDRTKLALPNTLTPAEVATVTSPAARKIYTWNSSKGLVEVTAANIAQLQTIAGAYGVSPSTKFSTNVVSFIRGYDANGATPWSEPRDWWLGPMINTTPALQGPPIVYKQTTVKPHAPFESLYKNRHPLVWAGSDDGMMHAFDFATGLEELAILPPNLLPLQIQLYDNYMIPNKVTGDPGDRLTGQPDRIATHLYGVANSFRFADVWFQSDNAYHTVGLISEGPGGNLVAAIDVTHPYGGNTTLGTSADPNYVSGTPFTVLWSVTGGSGAGQLNGLYSTWSVPAMAPTVNDTWNVLIGGGYNTASTKAAQVAPRIFSADLSSSPTNPVFSTYTLTNRATTPTVLVGNQSFADSVAFSTLKSAFHSDNLATLGIQADLNGQLWFQAGTDLSASRYVGIDATGIAALSTQQPIYYSPAVTGYGEASNGCDIYGFGSGSFYEKSTFVTGSSVGSGTNFFPSLYVGIGPKPASGANAAPLTAANVYRIPITGTAFNAGDPDNPTATRTLGPHSQLTASPFVIAPLNGTDPAQVLFLVYDPDVGCTGESYVVSLSFAVPSTCTKPTIAATDRIAWDAGAGAASGFAIAGNTLMVSKSGLGAGGRAGLYAPPNVTLATGSQTKVQPVWWKEHK